MLAKLEQKEKWYCREKKSMAENLEVYYLLRVKEPKKKDYGRELLRAAR